MNGTYRLTGDFALSHHTDPLHGGRIVRDINLTPNDRRLPDVAVCRIFTSRADAEKILVALNAAGATNPQGGTLMAPDEVMAQMPKGSRER